MEAWSYIGNDSEERLIKLSDEFSFIQLANRLKNEMQFVCFHQELRSDNPEYSRAIFCAHVGKELFDLFFNSLSGYRGAYFKSPENGLEANRQLFKVLSPSLISWAIKNHSHINDDWLVASLKQPSAKAWLLEYPSPFEDCDECKPQWDSGYQAELRIANGKWECSDKPTFSDWSRQAPSLTKLRFFGGFINTEHKEWVADHKKNRATQIWQYGWA